MAKKKKKRKSKSGVTRALEQKKAVSLEADPPGSCRFTDAAGQLQCESQVLKSYCDGKGGFFVPYGRC